MAHETFDVVGLYNMEEMVFARCTNYEKAQNDAIIARLKAEKEYFGEFAPQQHLFEQYGI